MTHGCVTAPAAPARDVVISSVSKRTRPVSSSAKCSRAPTAGTHEGNLSPISMFFFVPSYKANYEILLTESEVDLVMPLVIFPPALTYN